MYPKRSTTLKKKEGRKHTVPTHPSAVMVLALGIFKKHVGKGGRNTAWKVRKAKWQLAHGLEARDSGGKAGKFRKIQGGRWRGVVWVRGDGFHGEGHSLSLSLAMRCSTVDRFMGIALSPMAQSKRESNGGRSARAQFHRAWNTDFIIRLLILRHGRSSGPREPSIKFSLEISRVRAAAGSTGSMEIALEYIFEADGGTGGSGQMNEWRASEREKKKKRKIERFCANR